MPEAKGPEKDISLVVHSIRHGETSRILNLFSRTKGLISVIAKGARKGKSGAALGTVDPPSKIEAVIYFKSSRSVQTLGQVSLLNSYRGIKSSLTSTVFASVILQYLYRAFTQGELNSDAFDAADSALSDFDQLAQAERELEKTPDSVFLESNKRLALWLFQLKLIESLGFGIDLFHCPYCGESKSGVLVQNKLIINAGGFCCRSCSPENSETISFSGESVMILRRLTLNGEPNLGKLRVSHFSRNEITLGLHKFLRFHHGNLGNLSALEMISKFENPINPVKSNSDPTFKERT